MAADFNPYSLNLDSTSDSAPDSDSDFVAYSNNSDNSALEYGEDSSGDLQFDDLEDLDGFNVPEDDEEEEDGEDVEDEENEEDEQEEGGTEVIIFQEYDEVDNSDHIHREEEELSVVIIAD